jgi:hypothetical protein
MLYYLKYAISNAIFKWNRLNGNSFSIRFGKMRFFSILNILKKSEDYYSEKKGVYFNRAVGSYCHHSTTDGDIDAGTAKGQKTGTGD